MIISNINKIENKILKYDDLLYKSGPIQVNDFLNDKYDDIHKQLYNRALNKFIEEYIQTNNLDISIENFKKNYKFIEIKKDEYFKPSKVLIKSVKVPFGILEGKAIDLSKYWDKYEFNTNFKDLSEILFDEDSIKDAELIYIDYVKGKGKFKSKFTEKSFWVDFKFINNNTKINKDSFSLENTFTYKFRNKI